MNGIDLVEKLAEMRRQHDDAHRHVHSIEHYRKRHARRHPERLCEGHVPRISLVSEPEGRLPLLEGASRCGGPQKLDMYLLTTSSSPRGGSWF
jgi:hypothetical protein